MEQLWCLYVETYNELTRELDVERILAAEDAAGESSFQAGFPTRYLRTQTPEAVSLHGKLHELAATRGVAVDVKKRDGVWHLVVAARDRAGLFASLCGAISGFHALIGSGTTPPCSFTPTTGRQAATVATGSPNGFYHGVATDGSNVLFQALDSDGGAGVGGHERGNRGAR